MQLPRRGPMRKKLPLMGPQQQRQRRQLSVSWQQPSPAKLPYQTRGTLLEIH